MIYQSLMVGRDVEEFDSGYGESSRYAAHLDRGWALLDRGELVAARTSVEHAQEVRPDDPDASVLLGAISLAEGDSAQALRCYERALELDAEYLEPYVAAAQVCLFDLDDPARALRFCEDALELERLGPFEAVDLELLQAECRLALDVFLKETPGGLELGHADDFTIVVNTLELAARGPKDEDLTHDDIRMVQAAEYLMVDHDGDALDEEEQRDRTARAFQLVMRWARLQIDLGRIEDAAERLNALTQWFPHEADAWYLLSEAHLRSGDVLHTVEASLRTLELDARTEFPPWLPSVGTLQRRALAALQSVEVPAVKEAIEQERSIAVLIQERPAPELVAEGIDPRLPVLALGTRADPSKPALTLTGVAFYIANIARVCRDEVQFEDELRACLNDELTQFFTAAVLAEPPAEEPEKKSARRKRRRRKTS